MKKIGKKLSYLMRVLLACGLLFSNLSSFAVVFADEIDDKTVVGETNEEDEKEITTEGEGDTPSVVETPSEEGEKETPTEEVEGEKKEEETPTEGETLVESDTPVEGETPVETETPTEETPTESEVPTEGETPTEEEKTVEVNYEVYVDGALYTGDVYGIAVSKDAKLIEVKATLTGATAEEDYTLRIDDGGTYTAADLVNGAVVFSDEPAGNLYGNFCLDLMGTLTNPEGMEEDFEEFFCFDYGDESDNDAALSAVNTDYVFAHSKLTAPTFDLDTVTGIVTSVFSKVSVEYDEENKELWLEDAHHHCAAYMKVTGNELYGDINEDGVVDEKDLDAMIDQMIADVPVNILADLNEDGYIDEVDVIYLRQLLDKGEVTGATEEDVTIPAKFDEFTNPVKVGDEFTLQYVVTLNEYTFNGISGYISYDEEKLELVSTSVNYFDLGDIDNGRFIYLGDALKLEKTVTQDEDGNEVVTYEAVDYVLVTLTFKALSAGDTTVYADGIVYLNEESYYYSYEEVSADVTIEESDEEDPTEEEPSSFSSLSVAGQDIELKDGETNYNITVGNDVTAVDLDYVLANEGVEVISVLAPEELEVGENTVEITVLDNGVEKTYTITVTREAEAEEETTPEEVAAPVNYTPTSYEEPTSSDDKEVKPDDSKEDDKKEETKKDGLSRIIIIILILLVIAGLIYLIFRDEDDEETKKANKDVEKLKREDLVREVPKKSNSPNRNNNKNTKKGR
jgi:hypothetical protein